MKQLTYQVSFTTPAFLGNAEQAGQWRTPPFKAQLRQWWRMSYAAEKQFKFDLGAMRRDEGRLFGNAWLEKDFCKSLVRIRLDQWNEGSLKSWQPLATVRHEEVKFPVGSDLYLGYGPLTLPRGGKQPVLKANAAIQAGESAGFSIAFPTSHTDPAMNEFLVSNGPRLERALWLMDRYGTMGGRSRNGWGSLSLSPVSDGKEWDRDVTGNLPQRRWQDALDRDWPHAIGTDDTGALIWQTNPFSDWKALMRELAVIKIGLRTQFKFNSGKNAQKAEERHWLSYPVTNHSVNSWGNNLRLPNTLRFKVRTQADGKLVGVIFHIPHMPPSQFKPDPRVIEGIWRKVHAYLDDPAHNLKRIKE